MATRNMKNRNIKTKNTKTKNTKTKNTKTRNRKGGATECERLPFSRLGYDELHDNYQKYCTNFMDKIRNKDCCITLEKKFKNWTTDGRDFDIEQTDYDDTYNKINNIPEDNSYEEEKFIRASIPSSGGKSKRNYKSKSKRK
jgi:hypothetical protein